MKEICGFVDSKGQFHKTEQSYSWWLKLKWW